MWDIILKEKVEILMEWKKLDQGLRLTHELDERLLSDEFLEAITQDLGVRLGKNLPRWKGNLMRKMME
jgi:hypothetical protein